MTVSLIVDMMVAYQHDHKMAANDIMNIHKSPALEANGSKLFYESLLLALMSLILNHRDSPSDHSILGSTNFPKQSLFYSQVFSKILAAGKDSDGSDKGVMSGALRAALDVYIVSFVSRFTFETSGAGKLMQTLVKLSVFLQG